MLDYDDEEYYIMNSMDFIKTLNDGFILVADLKLNTYLSIYYDEKNKRYSTEWSCCSQQQQQQQQDDLCKRGIVC